MTRINKSGTILPGFHFITPGAIHIRLLLSAANHCDRILTPTTANFAPFTDFKLLLTDHPYCQMN